MSAKSRMQHWCLAENNGIHEHSLSLGKGIWGQKQYLHIPASPRESRRGGSRIYEEKRREVFYFLINFYQCTVVLWRCISFYYAAKWISHTYTYISSLWTSFPFRSRCSCSEEELTVPQMLNEEPRMTENVIHGSDCKESADNEIAIFNQVKIG